MRAPSRSPPPSRTRRAPPRCRRHTSEHSNGDAATPASIRTEKRWRRRRCSCRTLSGGRLATLPPRLHR
eukprot:4380530-Prymnesium_polylepis.1